MFSMYPKFYYLSLQLLKQSNHEQYHAGNISLRIEHKKHESMEYKWTKGM